MGVRHEPINPDRHEPMNSDRHEPIDPVYQEQIDPVYQKPIDGFAAYQGTTSQPGRFAPPIRQPSRFAPYQPPTVSPVVSRPRLVSSVVLRSPSKGLGILRFIRDLFYFFIANKNIFYLSKCIWICMDIVNHLPHIWNDQKLARMVTKLSYEIAQVIGKGSYCSKALQLFLVSVLNKSS